jgi:PAS domain S-box-containing protein
LIDYLFFANKTQKVVLNNGIKKIKERETVFKDFITDSEMTLRSIRELPAFNKYLENGFNKKGIEDIFLSYSKSNRNFMQLRFIDKNGMEKIRVDRRAQNGSSYLIKEQNLQNKSHRYYFKDSKNKPLEEAWFSKLDLNIENKKVEIPFNPTLRATYPIKYNGSFAGVLIINYFMEEFLNKLVNLPLYDIVMFDENGCIIKHYEPSKEWGFYKAEKYNIFQQFPQKDHKQMLSKKLLLTDSYVSSIIDLPLEGQLHILLKLKDSYVKEQKQENLNQYLLVATITFIISLVLTMLIVKQFSIILSKLENKNKILESIYNTSKEGIAVLNRDTKYLYFNQAYMKMLGFGEKELRSKSCLELTLPENVEESGRIYEKVLKEGYYENYERKCLTKNGKVKILNSSIALMPDKKSFLLTTTDHTLLREKEKEIEEQKKQLIIQSKMISISQLLRNIAHQWRQPLSIITTAISGLQMKYEMGIEVSKEDINNIVEIVDENANYLSQTIDDIKNYMHGNYSYGNFDLERVITEMLDMESEIIYENNITVFKNIESNIELYNSKEGLLQVLLNIVNNSIEILKNNDGKRYIYLDVYLTADNLIVKIKDNGGGIDEENITKIFDPYFTTFHQSTGKGMGLNIAYNVVTKTLKGEISVRNVEFLTSDNENLKGAEFKIVMPVDLESFR